MSNTMTKAEWQALLERQVQQRSEEELPKFDHSARENHGIRVNRQLNAGERQVRESYQANRKTFDPETQKQWDVYVDTRCKTLIHQSLTKYSEQVLGEQYTKGIAIRVAKVRDQLRDQLRKEFADEVAAIRKQFTDEIATLRKELAVKDGVHRGSVTELPAFLRK